MIDLNCQVNIIDAVNALRQGKILLGATDTVWGLMCDFENTQAVTSIFEIKRCSPRPLAVLCASVDCMKMLDIQLTDQARNIADAFWPGAITLVLKSDSGNISHLSGEDNTIGVRIPDSKELCNLIGQYGRPLAATSANISGYSASRSFDEVPDSIKKQASFICNFNINPSGKVSTVIDCSSERLKLIREGAVSFNRIIEIAGQHE